MKNTQRQTKSRRVDIAATLPHTSHGIANEKTTTEWQGPVSCTNLCPGKESGRLVPVDDFEGLAHVGRDARPKPGRLQSLSAASGRGHISSATLWPAMNC